MSLPFSDWLKKRRRALDLTQADLAERAFCSVNTIRKIEAGALMPSKALAQEIARALDVPQDAHAEFVAFARKRSATAPETAFSAIPLPAPPSAPPAAPAPKFTPPSPLLPAIGRERDTNVVINILRLSTTRLVTLTGPPGTGKTRLALEIANQVQDEFQHGVTFVELAPLAQADLIENAIAQILDIHKAGEPTLGAALQKFLRDKELLLVLDNFEHLLNRPENRNAAQLVIELLRAAPHLKILTTSREPLHVYGEREFPLAPLELPPLDTLPAHTDLEKFSAVQLFVERAQAVEPDFELTAQNREAVARLCVGLDGLPLAIELAAARIKYETPRALLAQWNQRLDKFSSAMRGRDARQQTLRGAMDWSYERLDETEQYVLRHLGVFRGSFTLQQVNAVCETDAQAILLTLVEKSLVKHELAADGSARFILLEMIREYALEKLTQHGETERASERHWEFFFTLARNLQTMPSQSAAAALVRRLRVERDNLNRALDWAMQSGRAAQVLTLTSALGEYWYVESNILYTLNWFERVHAMVLPADRELALAKAHVQFLYAQYLRIAGELARAQSLFQETISELRALGDAAKPLTRQALAAYSRLLLWRGEFETAETCARQALDLALQEQEPLGLAGAWRQLGECALARAQFAYARECLDHAVALTQNETNHFAGAVSFLERGDIARAIGDYAAARADYQAAQRLNQIVGNQVVEIRIQDRFGVLTAWEGDPARGAQFILDAMRLRLRHGIVSVIPILFFGLALCQALQTHTAQALYWLGVMDHTLATLQIVLIGAERFEYSKLLELVAQQASADALAHWRAEGRAHAARATLAEIAAFALSDSLVL